MACITASNLSKSFTTKVSSSHKFSTFHSLGKSEKNVVEAVKSVSFEIDDGEFVALLGPRGSGKSTAIKMLMGMVEPNNGSVSVLGLDPTKERRELTKYVNSVFGQKSQLWGHLSVRDSFKLIASMYGIEADDRKWRESELVERFGIASYMDVPVRRLPLDEKVRCEIAASLLSCPLVLFLDEPASGLSLSAKKSIYAALAETAKEDGTTVILSSNDLSEVEEVCSRAIIVNKGSIIADESMLALTKTMMGVASLENVISNITGKNNEEENVNSNLEYSKNSYRPYVYA